MKIIKYRTQNDGLNDEVSEQTGLDTTYDWTGEEIPNPVRPEYGDAADINNILQRHNAVPGRPHEVGNTEIDYSLGLQETMDAYRAVKEAQYGIPVELQQQYPNMGTYLQAVESGQYAQDLQKLTDRKDAEKRRAEAAAELAKKSELAGLEALNEEQRKRQRIAEEMVKMTDATPKETTPKN